MESLVAVARRHGALLAVPGALAAFYFWLNAFDSLGSIAGDGLIYLLTARDYAPYGSHDALAEYCARTTQFPPAYALLLAATGGAARFWIAHEVTTLCLLAALAAFYAWLRALALPRWQAVAGVALFAVLPGTFRQSLYLHPESLYLALVFGALTCLALAGQRAQPGLFWLAALAIALAIVTRTVGITLLPALGVALLRHRPRGWAGMALLAVAPAALWAAYHHPPRAYADALLEHYDGASVAAVMQGVTTYVAASVDGLASNVSDAPALRGLVLMLGAMALAAGGWRLSKLQAEAWYLFAYLGVLALWPFPREAWRLTWVLVPVLLGYLLWAAQLGIARLTTLPQRAAAALRFAPVAALGLIVVPGAALLVARAVHPLTVQNPALRHLPEWYDPFAPGAEWLAKMNLGTVEALRDFGAQVPAGECVISTKDLVVSFYSGHPVVPAPAESLDARAFDQQLARAGCRYFVLLYGSGRAYAQPFYPRERLAGRLQVVAEQRIDAGPPGERLVAQLAVLRP